jgi:hypothetical protein
MMLVFKYESYAESDPILDKIFAYMDKNKVDIEDYRVQRHTDIKTGTGVLHLGLGIRIRYKDNIESDIRSFVTRGGSS